jgi:alpha-galactosidase
MSIFYDQSHHLFHLQSLGMSYVIQVVKGRYLAHLYWGKRLRLGNLDDLLQFVERTSFCANPDPLDPSFSLDTLPQEYPGYGTSDFRVPAFQVQLRDGFTLVDFQYQNYRIFHGKPALEGLPSTYVESDEEATSLEIEFNDPVCGLTLFLTYIIYESRNVLTRSARFINHGPERPKILRALSMNIDFADADFELLHLEGAWARERQLERRPLLTGSQSIESRRGSSSHQHNPFLALLRKETTEDYGEVFGFNLVYSGSFLGQVEVDQFKTARIAMGINPFDFSWLLEPGESFQTPEVVMVYSSEGLGGMSRIYHQLYRTRLCRGLYRDQERPILINNWEATYFDFNAEKVEKIAKTAGELGIELFVLDDGWFGKRNDDKSSLGDWFVNREKLPGGLKDLIQRVNRHGLQFGLWFEPEMISPDSELYRLHPDWCLHVPDRSCTQARHQLILDLSRDDVCQTVIKMLTEILAANPISYVKWDMNRNMTEIGSAKLPPERQRETAHRYILNLYKMMDKITCSFPQILFEGCSGGGGRFDPGILYFMPQIWTSDDTDAIARLKIQYGTSIVYPPVTMGSHVSAVPNHQLKRATSLEIRSHVASSGCFGYELDLNQLERAEQQLVQQQVAFYKEIRRIIQFGDYYRILSPFEGNEAAWIFVTEDKTEAVAFYFKVLAEPNPPLRRVRLRGLDPLKDYQLSGEEQILGGDVLMNAGINIPESKLLGDFQSICWRLKAPSNSSPNSNHDL